MMCSWTHDVHGADVHGANVCGANVCGANVCGANVCGANVCGCAMTRMRDLKTTTRGWMRMDAVRCCATTEDRA